jgi:hypothetical protein
VATVPSLGFFWSAQFFSVFVWQEMQIPPTPVRVVVVAEVGRGVVRRGDDADVVRRGGALPMRVRRLLPRPFAPRDVFMSGGTLWSTWHCMHVLSLSVVAVVGEATSGRPPGACPEDDACSITWWYARPAGVGDAYAVVVQGGRPPRLALGAREAALVRVAAEQLHPRSGCSSRRRPVRERGSGCGTRCRSASSGGARRAAKLNGPAPFVSRKSTAFVPLFGVTMDCRTR